MVNNLQVQAVQTLEQEIKKAQIAVTDGAASIILFNMREQIWGLLSYLRTIDNYTDSH